MLDIPDRRAQRKLSRTRPCAMCYPVRQQVWRPESLLQEWFESQSTATAKSATSTSEDKSLTRRLPNTQAKESGKITSKLSAFAVFMVQLRIPYSNRKRGVTRTSSKR